MKKPITAAKNPPIKREISGAKPIRVAIKAETLNPEYGLDTRVHYIGLPKRFIAGTVYDPSSKEVVIGATCTVTGEGGPYSKTTDEFGDFWFDGLPEGAFTLEISADGYTTKTMPVDTKEADVNLMDIALS